MRSLNGRRIRAVTVTIFLVAAYIVAPASGVLAGEHNERPRIHLDKTVALGHDNGASCPGDDLVVGQVGDDIAYCFEVSNIGGTYLSDIVITDKQLGIDESDMTLVSGNPDLLAPGESALWYYDTTIDKARVNAAKATGTPVDESGEPTGDEPVNDWDETEVEVGQPAVEPDIEINKTVYEGHDSGALCEGVDLVITAPGAAVTYCFFVTNTGNTHLADVTVDDPDLGISEADMTLLSGDATLLAPNATVAWYYEAKVDGDLVNVATTTGDPADEQGEPVDAEPPTDKDDAEVDEVVEPPVPTTDIEISKTVYVGHDSGVSCEGHELVEDEVGTDITYCFFVTNTGEAHLADVVVDDDDLSITDADMTLLSGDPSLLAPDATVAWYYETTLDDDLVNTADTTGTPSDPQGNPVEIEPPTDSDPAEVQELEVSPEDEEPDIKIDKTVYLGHNSGNSCPGKNKLFDQLGSDITYCFIVTNTGTTWLKNVTVDDPDINIDEGDMTLKSGNPAFMAPDAVVVWYYETTLDDDLVNTATTTGTPSDEEGNTIPAEPPTDSDDAEVGEEDVLDETLPATGFETDDFALLGLGFLLLGAVALEAARRRSQRMGTEGGPHLWGSGHNTVPESKGRFGINRRLRM